jgi:hypothetical protein
MLSLLRDRELGKNRKKEIIDTIQKRCISELQKNDLTTFINLVESGLYEINIYIDNEKIKEINNYCHNIRIEFINNINKTSSVTELEKILLVRMSDHIYNYFDNHNDINTDIEIYSGTMSLTYKNIKLDPKIILEKVYNIPTKNTKYYKLCMLFVLLCSFILFLYYKN